MKWFEVLKSLNGGIMCYSLESIKESMLRDFEELEAKTIYKVDDLSLEFAKLMTKEKLNYQWFLSLDNNPFIDFDNKSKWFKGDLESVCEKLCKKYFNVGKRSLK